MESAPSTDYASTATSGTETESSLEEPKAPEGTLLRKVQDAKESILVLKNQVSFAEQCLSLLHNQMKHASDTLAILQDQVELAQRTVNSLTEGSVAGLSIPQPQMTTASSTSCRPQTTSQSDSNEQQVIVHDSDGPKVYSLSKSSISLGNSDWPASREQGQGPCVIQQVQMHCHCPACVSRATVSTPLPCHPSCHPPTGAVLVEVSPEMKQSSHSPSVVGTGKVKSLFPSPSSKTASSDENTKGISGEKEISVKKESVSTSPMAHQLLQVIDVLQTEDDDDRSTTRTSHVSSSHGSPGILYGKGTASWPRTSRRHRKQNMSPVKVLLSHSTSQERSSSGRSAIRELPELMRVPPPVLASSLEPEFLVVPTSSYSYDSPPTSASGQGNKEEAKKSSEVVSTNTSTPILSQDASHSCTTVSSVIRVAEPQYSQCCPKGGVETDETYNCRSSNTIKAKLQVSTEKSSETLSPLKTQRPEDPVDVNGLSSSPLSPKKRFTGTSPLNSDVGMPFLSKVQSLNSVKSPSCRNDSDVTTVNSVVQPVSVEPVVSQLEHHRENSSATLTSNHVTGSQATSVTVLSLSRSVESSPPGKKLTTSSSKKPIILSRRPSQSNEQNLPQGLVVLVPTLEDAKRLIASSGGQSDGHTPVLVPQHMLSDVSKKAVTEEQMDARSQLLGKRSHDVVSSSCGTQSKRPALDSIVIE
ncbi:hypothetical protein P5673_010193 [Acropora cervicornis]|uniref:Uncharacterized protein n=1 Tax=Acropora cervicornis TaxID=6130 RepID=A0AAD9V976_ACRCE|nr:hypothetical protein P5673_010193 [Acropora cervicornis]